MLKVIFSINELQIYTNIRINSTKMGKNRHFEAKNYRF